MPRIACLHTAPSNVAVFDAALRQLSLPHVVLSHRVRADLLAAAERAGGLTATVAGETGQALQSLCGDADAVLLTCSTLGPAADALAASATPILRVDTALAGAAVAQAQAAPGGLVVLCAVATTMAPTRALFARAAEAAGVAVSIRLVPDAWAAFRAGDAASYHRLIATAAEAAIAEGAGCVALAQASMAGAVRLVPGGGLLDSPSIGLAAAIRAAGG